MNYHLNLLGTTVTQERERKFRRYTSAYFIIVWLVTGFTLFHFYRGQVYIAGIYEEKISTIERRITSIEPKVLFLRNQVRKRDLLKSKLGFFTQLEKRPLVWTARLLHFRESLPLNSVLTDIQYRPTASPGSDEPEISVAGYSVFDAQDQNLFAIDTFVEDLSDQPFNRTVYHTVKVDENRIFRSGEDLILEFKIGFYE